MLLFACLLPIAVALAACTYNAPPEVEMESVNYNRFLVGEPIPLKFSEPIDPESLAIKVWPGQKALYDLEGRLSPEIDPVLDLCTVGTSPCGRNKGVALTMMKGGTEAVITVKEGALGGFGEPLVLEVVGDLADSSGHAKGVSAYFDFQVIDEDWNTSIIPDSDALSDDDAVQKEPLGIAEGPHLFYMQAESPVKLTQHFWCDIEMNQMTGFMVALCTDGDAEKDAPVNTMDPAEIYLDTGPEGYIFTFTGLFILDPDEGIIFETNPVVFAQTIGPIYFELRDMILRGRVVVDEETGLSSWNGTMTVSEIYYEVGDKGTTYPADMSNFLVFELTDEQVPEGLPTNHRAPDPRGTPQDVLERSMLPGRGTMRPPRWRMATTRGMQRRGMTIGQEGTGCPVGSSPSFQSPRGDAHRKWFLC